MTSYLNRRTPGVYITEFDAFPSSVVGVATAVPIFIGYTAFAAAPASQTPLHLVPTPISSLADFVSTFGSAAPRYFTVSQNASQPDCTVSARAGQAGFDLYRHIQLFFANGGNICYVVSCGSYWAGQKPVVTPHPATSAGFTPGTITAADLLAGLDVAANQAGVTMVVVPEACQLSVADGSYGSVVQAMLRQSGTIQDRMAIIDPPGLLAAATLAELEQGQSDLWTAAAPQVANASYGAAYAPALNATIATLADILYTDFRAADGDDSLINAVLTADALLLYKTAPAQLATIQAAIAAAFPVPTPAPYLSSDASAYPADTGERTEHWQDGLDAFLFAALPVYHDMKQRALDLINVVSPAGAMAGIWTRSDAQGGVWNAPANIALAGVASPIYLMTDLEQGAFNVPVNGEAINVIRAQPARGNVVWGARTLDGNSNDYRYIQVRRTLIYVETSIRLALQTYAFAANDATTWASVTASLSAFLTGLWQQGGLMGAKASEAFTVTCGLGTTMTAQNVLEGQMIVQVTLQMIHPAEFIALSFTQTLSG